MNCTDAYREALTQDFCPSTGPAAPKPAPDGHGAAADGEAPGTGSGEAPRRLTPRGSRR